MCYSESNTRLATTKNWLDSVLFKDLKKKNCKTDKANIALNVKSREKKL